MAKERKILAQNIVLVADSVNVSSFSQYWFIKNRIFSEEEFSGSVFTPGFTLVSAPDCQLTVLPNQIQFEIKEDDADLALECINNRLTKIIRCISNIRVIGIGINFIWKVTDNELSIPELSKQLFGVSNSPLHSYFCKADTRYGAYFSQNIDQFTRLKLDIKPSITKVNGQSIELLMFNFNFHCDVPEQQMELVLQEQMRKWLSFNQLAQDLACL